MIAGFSENEGGESYVMRKPVNTLNRTETFTGVNGKLAEQHTAGTYTISAYPRDCFSSRSILGKKSVKPSVADIMTAIQGKL